jgi:polysaccharide biosynthesis/export protein
MKHAQPTIRIVMVIASILLLPALFPITGAAQTQPSGERAAPLAPDYIIGPGDVLFVSVWKDPDLTQSVPVRPDGRFSFPLIGEIQAGGRTVAQVKEEMEQKISRFVPEPVLTVGLLEIRSMFIYVIGRVNQPGRFPVYSNVDVLQALAMAGGCNTFADTKRIKVFRKSGDRTVIMDFNYNEVSSGKSLEQNIMLERSDVIVVP